MKFEDPTIEIRRRVNEINRNIAPSPDAQELREREEAAQAYAGENESHFVRFLDDCVSTSVNSMQEIRRNQSELWDVFNEEEPRTFALKESWQAKVVVPKPYSTVQFAMAIVRKAFNTDFLNIKNKLDEEGAEFWMQLMTLLLLPGLCQFPHSIYRCDRDELCHRAIFRNDPGLAARPGAPLHPHGTLEDSPGS